MVSITPVGGGGKAGHVTRWSGLQHLLGGDRRDVVALVDHDVPVIGQQLLQVLPACQALHGRDVQTAFWFVPARADDPDLLDGEIKELGQPLDPLLEKRLAVHHHERRAAAGGDQVRRDHCLADPRRRAQHPQLVREHLLRGLGLGVGQLAREPGIELGPVGALVGQLQSYTETVEQFYQRCEAAAGEHEKLALLLEAGDHARRARRGDPQPLTFQEQRVGERREPTHRVQQSGGQSLAAHVQALCERRAEDIRHRRRGEPAGERPGRTPRRLAVDRLFGNTQNLTGGIGLLNRRASGLRSTRNRGSAWPGR